MKKVYQRIAELLQAIENCEQSGNTEWKGKHEDILAYVMEFAPSGSGIDNGTKLGDDSKPERLVFRCSYHHMNDAGMYDGWTDHSIIVTPSLVFGFNVRITGKDRNGIKDYLGEVYRSWLDCRGD